MNVGDLLTSTYVAGSSDGAPVPCMEVLPACKIDATSQIGGYGQSTSPIHTQKIGAPKPFL